MMHGWGWNAGMGMGLGGGIIPLVLVSVLILGGFWVVRTIYRDRNDESEPGGYHEAGDAREILRQRYARGEITRDDFVSMKEDLG